MKLVNITTLFNIKYGNSFELINLGQCEKNNVNAIAFVSRTEKNNGISAFVYKLPDIEPNPPGTVTVAVGGSVLSTFLQLKPYYTGFHILILYPKEEMTEQELLFYSYCIRKNKYRYNYGRQANKTLKDILIPEKIPAEWKSSNIDDIEKLKFAPVSKEKINLNISNWKYFDLTELFEISASRDELIEDLTQGGSTPYITSSDSDNGATSFIEEVATNKAGTITANRGGSVGYFYYQPIAYKATPVDVRILTPRFKINTYLGLFFRTILQLEKYRYNYSRKMGSDRLAQLRIKLPANNKLPDWDFIENYIKSLPYSSSL